MISFTFTGRLVSDVNCVPLGESAVLVIIVGDESVFLIVRLYGEATKQAS